MSKIAPLPLTDETRRDRILTAAERAFARHGFHGANMQHVALEAGMSAGNLYRTFASKLDIVSGLTARDQAALAQDFEALAAAPVLMPAIATLLRKHLVEEPLWKARLMLEIWAEAGRNPDIASLCGAINGDVQTRLVALIDGARLAPAPAVDPTLVARIMMTMVSGLFKRRATEPGFEAETEIALALAVFRAALDGALTPYLEGTLP